MPASCILKTTCRKKFMRLPLQPWNDLHFWNKWQRSLLIKVQMSVHNMLLQRSHNTYKYKSHNTSTYILYVRECMYPCSIKSISCWTHSRPVAVAAVHMSNKWVTLDSNNLVCNWAAVWTDKIAMIIAIPSSKTTCGIYNRHLSISCMLTELIVYVTRFANRDLIV